MGIQAIWSTSIAYTVLRILVHKSNVFLRILGDYNIDQRFYDFLL